MISLVLILTALLIPVLAMALFLHNQARKSSRQQKQIRERGGLLIASCPVSFEAFRTHRTGRFQSEPLRNVYAMDYARFIWQDHTLYLFGKTRFFLFTWYLPPLKLCSWDWLKEQSAVVPEKNLWFAHVLKLKPEEAVLRLAKNTDGPQVLLHIRKATPALLSKMEAAPFLAAQETNRSRGGISPEAMPQ